MSYILDALRRADAERERGQVPGIHAQQLALAAADADGDGAGRPGTWLWVSFGLSAVLLALVALLGWYGFGRGTAPAAAPVTPITAAAVPAAPAVPAVPAVPATPAAPATAAAPPAPTPTPQLSSVAAARTAHAPAPPHPSKRALHKPQPGTQSGAVAQAQPAAPVKAGAPEPSTDRRLYTLDELPAEIRRQLPALAIGGASYSNNPSSRMLIVNGQVFHERDRLTPELQLQQIRLRSAVLDFKGYRYEIKY